MKYITKIFDLGMISLIFLGFFFLVATDSINYYFSNKSFEGYQIVVSNMFFTILNLPFLVLLFIRKDFDNLKEVGIIVITTFISGFLGFKIPLTILPIVIGYGLFRLGKQIKNRIIEIQKNN